MDYESEMWNIIATHLRHCATLNTPSINQRCNEYLNGMSM